MSYRAIGQELGCSNVWAMKLCERAFAEVAARVTESAAAVLGEQLVRAEFLVSEAMTIVADPQAPVGERLRAIEAVGRCQERIVRWTGVAAPQRLQVEAELRGVATVREEVAAMSDEAVARELERLGWSPPGSAEASLPAS